MKNIKHLITLNLVFAAYFLAAQTTYLHCGKLLDCVSNEAKSEMTIIVEGTRIKDVVKGYAKAPADAKVIDLKSRTVMPGLMDMHIHVESESNPKSDEERFRQTPSDVAYVAESFGKKTLMAGFTTVRDLGGGGVNVSRRSASTAGVVDGARVFPCEG